MQLPDPKNFWPETVSNKTDSDVTGLNDVAWIKPDQPPTTSSSSSSECCGPATRSKLSFNITNKYKRSNNNNNNGVIKRINTLKNTKSPMDLGIISP